MFCRVCQSVFAANQSPLGGHHNASPVFLYKKGGESPRRSVDQGLTTSPSLQYQYHKPIVCICYHANSDLSNKKYSDTAPAGGTLGAFYAQKRD